ncbi:hypothetical protein M406DRAFT_53336, partial [Cryphonectria parasitica EP155]
WARAGVDASHCYQNAQVNGSLVSTAFTARDLINIAEALDDDGMLRYWGFSYGTTLGATVAAMFPDKIDKMILDGVQNPWEYHGALADYQEWTASDDTFSQIFQTCVRAGENCSLNALNMTADQMEQATWNLLEYFKANPLPYGDIVYDYWTAKAQIWTALFVPQDWASLADLLTIFFTANTTELTALSASVANITSDTEATIAPALSERLALVAIHCSDRRPRAATLAEFQPVIDELYGISAIFGDGSDQINMPCAQWLIEPKERYNGGFDVDTANPVLILGNTWDPATPLASARNVSSGFNGSVVLEIHGYGHTSLAAPSRCTVEHTVAYWSNLTMPENGTVCELDAKPYTNATWTDIFMDLGWNYTVGFADSFTMEAMH